MKHMEEGQEPQEEQNHRVDQDRRGIWELTSTIQPSCSDNTNQSAWMKLTSEWREGTEKKQTQK